MDETLFLLTIVGGFFVLLSYAYTYQHPKSIYLWGGLTNTWFFIWLISVLLTVISYIFLWYMFIFILDDVKLFKIDMWVGDALLHIIYIVFLTSASQWAYIAIGDIERGMKTRWTFLNLWMTGVASFMLFVLCCAMSLDHVDQTTKTWMILTSGWMMIHHVGFDAIFWLSTFQPGAYSEI